ncbi:MAG TPA: glucosaminidase domain-containing protein [Allosphingosinicella sp.]|nr:glucosaminidase domain-containing protein [Allosphingosinicella sp.]
MESNSKLIDDRTFPRRAAMALLVCAATIPTAATAPVSAGTAGSVEGRNVDVTTNAAEEQPSVGLRAPVVARPSSGGQELPVQAEAVQSAANADRPDQSLAGPPTTERVFQAICAAGIRHPEIVMRQALLETGNLRHPMLMTRNNLFGFRSRAYLRFDKWQDSVAYYKRWQDRHYTNPSENYFRFLDRIRYASPGYQTYVMQFAWERSCPT